MSKFAKLYVCLVFCWALASAAVIEIASAVNHRSDAEVIRLLRDERTVCLNENECIIQQGIGDPKVIVVFGESC